MTHLPPHRPGFDDTQPSGASGRPGGAPERLPVEPRVADELMVLARRNNRVCPLPAPWHALHALLPPLRHRDGSTTPAPPPLDADWERTANLHKRLRLRQQMEWAERAGCLGTMHRFLADLPEDQWLHFPS